MKLNLIENQDYAINAILQAREQGKRAASFGMTLLNKSPRVLRGIRKGFERRAALQGWNAKQIAAQWQDVKDMAVLEANANE